MSPKSARLSAVVSVQSAKVQKRVSEAQKRVDNARLFDSDSPTNIFAEKGHVDTKQIFHGKAA
jgi:hypothetical protein